MSEQGTRMDEALFEEIYSKYANDVLRICCFYLRDRQQAEDITQDVFVKMLTHAPELEAGHEKAWLLKVALNRCRDHWRSGWVKRMVLGSPAMELTPDPADMDARMEKQELLAAIGKLPPDFKDAILLFYYQGFEINEIAEMTGLPEGTVSSRLSRARNKLKSVLKEDE